MRFASFPLHEMNRWLFLFVQWFKRDLANRYRGSWLGMLWPVLQPLVQVAVFTLIFHGFLQMRWPLAPQTEGSFPPADAWAYGLNVLAGLAVFNFFAEVLGRSPSAVLSQPNLVTKVRFPLVLLPAVTTATALLVHVGVGCAALVLFAGINGTLSYHIALLALWLVPVLLYGAGIALLLASMGVYVRDIGHVMPSVTSLLMFLTPIFYPLESVPSSLRQLFELNPIAWAAESLRSLLLKNEMFDFSDFFLHLIISTAIFTAGVYVFRKLETGFADVL